MWFKIVLVVFFNIFSLGVSQDNIFFRDENLELGSPCRTALGVGTCVLPTSCKNPPAQLLNDQNSICFFHQHRMPVLCCPLTNVEQNTGQPFISTQSNLIPTQRPTTNFNSALTNNQPRLSQQLCQKYSHNYTNKNGYYGIVLGTNAGIAEFPHMAVLGYPSEQNRSRNEWLCGGSLITERYVLTAAHCLARLQPNVVRLGERDLSSDADNNDVRDFGIESVTIHPLYKASSVYNDLALLRLDDTVRFTRFIRPACLSVVEDPSNLFLTATGWGHTSFGGTESQILQKVNLKYFTNEQCAENYKPSRRIQQGIVETQLCAGSTVDESDTCQGDSGGPLTHSVYEDNSRVNIHHIVGVTSFGRGCGTKVPAIYSRVYAFLDWIESVVSN